LGFRLKSVSIAAWRGCSASSKYRSAREPRDRLLRAVTEHHQALFDKLCNSKKAEQYGDLSDVSDIFKTRLKDWTSAGITIASCASANTALLWAANVNSAPVAFWLVWYVFQHEDLLEGIRREIRDYIRCEQTEDGSQLQFDVPALLNDCRLLNATYLETLRLEAHTFSFKVAKEDCHHRGSSRSDLLKSTATLCAEEGGFCLCSAFF
jgi:hypothetical protein